VIPSRTNSGIECPLFHQAFEPNCLKPGQLYIARGGIDVASPFYMIPAQLKLSTEDYSYLDEPDFSVKYATGAERSEMRFYVGGIRCGKCVRSMEGLVGNMPGLRRLRIEMGKNLAHVEVDPAILKFSEVADAISRLGFSLVPLASETAFEAVRAKEDQQDLIRLAVAGACAGNIMTFAFANYFGASSWSALFSWLSFIAYLPVVGFVAVPFYKGAWQSLKSRQISIDLPMTVASLAGFAFSVVELLRGRSDTYFDSLSGFLFLILISRFAHKRLERNFLRPQELSESLRLERVRKVEPSGWSWRTLEMLVPGDRFLVHAHETLPADAELISSKGYFSLAWLTGEAIGKTFLRGAVVPAGARLISGDALLQVKRSLADTSFGKILQEVQHFSLSKNRVVISADLWAQRLLATVFLVGVTFLILYWSISPEEAVRRTLALLIVACPCAMAFGTPLALASSLKRAQAKGLVVRDANVFEKLNRIKTVFFDKTGTLTETDLTLTSDSTRVPTVYQKIILGLENGSFHPIAFAFRKAFGSLNLVPPVDSFQETPAVGVSGYIYGKFYELRKNTLNPSEIGCTLFEDERAVHRFTFRAGIKADALQTLRGLRAQGYEVILLSGDQKAVVNELANALEFEPHDVHAEQLPHEKAAVVRASKGSLMVGDGVNDTLAMIESSASVAVSGGIATALKTADVYLAEEGIRGVAALLDISKNAFSLIRRNLFISATYNTVAGALALSGFVNPFVAALLMPISSAFILLSTWLAGRK
jgi:Cu+-exporting ATPase